MRQFVTSILLLLLPTVTFAQSVDLFANADSKWTVAETYPNANPQNPSFAETKTTIFGFSGDTAVNGKTWLKMYSTKDSLFTSDLNFEGYIHSSSNHTLKADSNFNIDTLYQFNLDVGDSVKFDFGPFSQKIPVIKKDSMLIGGSYYQTLHFAEPTGPNGFTVFEEKWIVGMGSVHGPLFPDRAEVFSTEIPDSLNLVCTRSNNVTLYQNPSYNSCIVNIVLGLDKPERSSIKLFPNPVSHQINVVTEIQGKKKVSIRSQSGQLLLSETHEQSNFTVEFRDFPKGLYFVTLEVNGEFKTWKLLKNK